MADDASLLHILRGCHTAITAATAGLIGYLVYGGLVALPLKGHPLLAVALAWPGLIGLQLLFNRGECVFQTWVKAIGHQSESWTRDLWAVPERWATAIPYIFTPPYVAGALLVLWRGW